jgi:hypothetical protein
VLVIVVTLLALALLAPAVVVLALGAVLDTLAVILLEAILALALLGVPVVDFVVLAVGLLNTLAVILLEAILALALLGVPVVDFVVFAVGLLRNTLVVILLEAILALALLGVPVVPLVLLAVRNRFVVVTLEELRLIPGIEDRVITSLEGEVGVDIRDGLDRDGQGEKADQDVLDLHDRLAWCLSATKVMIETKDEERMERR